MNYFNKYILYSPEPGYGGGGGDGIDYGGGDSGMGGDNQILAGQQETRCKITSLTVSKQGEYIKPKGGRRKIKIIGTSSCIFSLTIKDSSDCSILKEEIENVKIPENGIYEFDQDFPSILTDGGASRTKQTYTITIAPAADVTFQGMREDIILYQYADPIITVTNSFTAATIGGNINVTATDVTMTGPADTRSNNIPKYNKKNSNFTATTYTLVINEGSGGDVAGKFYIKNKGFNNNNVTTNTVIKKVVDRDGETGPTQQLNLKPLTTRVNTTIEGSDSITGDLVTGMNMYAKIEKTKTVFASLDKDDNKINYGECDTPTDKIELSNTNDLIEGMVVSGGNIIETSIKSIDCDKKITLSRKHIIRKYTELTFKREWSMGVTDIISQRNSSGNACINMSNSIDIPNSTIISFDDNRSMLQGQFVNSGSGGDAVTLTITLKPIMFGRKNVTYTLDLDNIITRKPNAHNQEVSIKKNSSINIKMIKGDTDANASSKTGTVVKPAAHGTVGDWNDGRKTFPYTPHTGFTGEDSFTFTMSDGTTSSEEKTIRIIVK